jgi:hypothetical protein
MGFSVETGYVPVTIEDIMSSIMAGVNTQFGTTYTTESFVGTNFYKFFYALAQRVMTNEVKMSEIFLKLQDYFKLTNETILNPKVTPTGLIDALEQAGYEASVKPMIDADAGKSYICVNLLGTEDDYVAMKLEVCGLIKDYTVAGVVTQGAESETLTLTNGQAFDFKYDLPNVTEDVLLRLTITTSRNNTSVISTPEESKQKLLENIQAQYSLGLDFEPERYFSVADAPWAGDILLEYSVDAGSNWLNDTFEANYDDLFEIKLENITLVEA